MVVVGMVIVYVKIRVAMIGPSEDFHRLMQSLPQPPQLLIANVGAPCPMRFPRGSAQAVKRR